MTYLKVICFNIYDFQSYNKPCTFSAGWLINAHQRTLSPTSNFSYDGYRIHQAGYIYTSQTCFTGLIRPVVYLKPNVKIINGKGTSTEPYQLSIN